MAKKGTGNKVGIYVIVGILCFAMIGFGATNFGGNVRSIGQVGDRDISASRYYNVLTGAIRQTSAQLGTPLTFADAQVLGVDQRALQELIAFVALEAEAGTLGISVGDTAVRDEILAVSAFQGLDGQFNREQYAQSLRRNGLTERQFEDDLRAEISRTLLQGAVVSAVAAPSPYTDALMTYIGERRSFTWTRLSADDQATDPGEPSDSDLRAYFSENEENFMRPETRRITFISVTPEMLLDQVALEEADLRAAYDARTDEFNMPERRLVERLILGSAATDAKARLDAGELTFEALVAERDLDLSDVSLGTVTIEDLGDVGEAVFATSEIGVVGPVETPLGGALFRVNAILAAQTTSFEEARPDLERSLGLVDAEAMIGGLIEDIDNLLAGGATLEEVATETDAELGQIDWTAESSMGLAADPAFRRAAATVTLDDFPEVSDLSDGGLFALRLNETVAPRLPSFDEAAEEIAAAWSRDTVIDALTEAAAPIVDALSAGSAPDAGTELRTELTLTRDAFVPGSSPDLMTRVFEMAAGDVTVLPADGAVEIIRLDDILPPDLEDATIAARREALETATEQAIGTDILGAFAVAVEAEAGISLDQMAIQAVHVNIP